MSKCSFVAGAVALTALVSPLAGCQSGFSIGGLGDKKPSERKVVERGADEADGVDDVEEAPETDAESSEDEAPAASGRLAIDWCKGRDTGYRGHLETIVRNAEGFDHGTIGSLAFQGCFKRIGDDARGDVLKLYGSLRKWSKLPAAELRDYLSALVAPSPDPIEKTCQELDLATQSGRGLGKLLECEDPNERAAGIDRFALEDDTSSALAALAAVHACLSVGSGGGLDGVKRVDSETSYALCGAEWRLLDRAVIDRELAKLKARPAVRTKVRLAFRQVEGSVAATDSFLAPTVKEDPVLKAFYYDVPDKAFRLALKVQRENAEDLAAVRAFESRYAKSSRPQVKGCYGDLRGRLMALLRSKKVRTLDKLRYELVGPVGYQLSRALEVCGRKDGQLEIAQFLAQNLAKADDFRGPRTMVYWFLRDALGKMEGDKPTTVEGLDRLRPSVPDPLGRPDLASWEVIHATIKKASKRGGDVLLEFETEVIKDEDRECWDTKKVREINEDGTVDYERACGPWKKVTRRHTEAPSLIRAENAAGLERGREVDMYCTPTDEEPRVCAPFAVAKKKSKELVSFLGASL